MYLSINTHRCTYMLMVGTSPLFYVQNVLYHHAYKGDLLINGVYFNVVRHSLFYLYHTYHLFHLQCVWACFPNTIRHCFSWWVPFNLSPPLKNHMREKNNKNNTPAFIEFILQWEKTLHSSVFAVWPRHAVPQACCPRRQYIDCCLQTNCQWIRSCWKDIAQLCSTELL